MTLALSGLALLVALLGVYIADRTRRVVERWLRAELARRAIATTEPPRGVVVGIAGESVEAGQVMIVERTCGSPPGDGRGGAGCRKPIGHQDGCAWERDDGILHATDEGLVFTDWQGRSSKVESL